LNLIGYTIQGNQFFIHFPFFLNNEGASLTEMFVNGSLFLTGAGNLTQIQLKAGRRFVLYLKPVFN